jgi:hypothetical protein
MASPTPSDKTPHSCRKSRTLFELSSWIQSDIHRGAAHPKVSPIWETITVDSSVIRRVMEEGSANAERFVARPMRRAAQRFVEDSLSDAIIQGFLKEGDAAMIKLAAMSKDGKDRVFVVRESAGEAFEAQIEDGKGGIGSSDSSFFVIGTPVSGCSGC